MTTGNAKLFAKFVQYLATKSPFYVNSGTSLTYLISAAGGVF